jgi:hypothetical protein
MSSSANWRSAADYAYVTDLDPAGLAWGFLRRNPEFRTDCGRAAASLSDASQPPLDLDALANRWGVHCPG